MDTLLSGWLAGLARYECIFIELIPLQKRPPKSWASYEEAHLANGGSCLYEAHRWLGDGGGLGFLLRGPLWVLDIDDSGEVERILCTLSEIGVFPPWVRTPSGGAHVYFRFPGNFSREGLKNHVCHPEDADGIRLLMDFKLGPRTLLVAPGTRKGEKLYQPMTPWQDPPIVDPRFFLPFGSFWKSPKRLFSVDSRSRESRFSRACAYLRSRRTPVSISGSGGRKILASVCAHLVAFLQLDPAMAYHLLIHGPAPWNSRCLDQAGKPFPWNHDELMKACNDAVDAIPRAGEVLYARNQRKQEHNEAIAVFCRMIKHAERDPTARFVSVHELRARFERWNGSPTSAALFGRDLEKHGIQRKFFTKRRIQGVRVDLEALEDGLVMSTRA